MIRIKAKYFIATLFAMILAVGAVSCSNSGTKQATEVHEEHSEEGQDDHGEEGHEDHGEEGEDEHGNEKVVHLEDQQIKEFGIELDTAGPGKLDIYIELPGEIVVNADRLAHVVPRVPGIVREVRKSLGDGVRAGEVMAILDSRDLADSKAAFLAAHERVELAQINFSREEDLWKQKISSEQEYLVAKQVLAETRIELRSAEQKLHALGFSDDYMEKLPDHPEDAFTRYKIIAPFDGTVIEKHITLGEVLKDDTEAFVIADLSSVWVDLSVYQRDLPFVRKGQSVVISAGHGLPDTTGKITYIRPVIGEETRTALARIVLPNPEGRWRPGLFVSGRIAVEAVEVSIRVARSALQTVEDKTVVFVTSGEGFEPQPITTGRGDRLYIEIESGIESGQQYVAKGAFTLKAQLSKGAFGDGHGH